MGISSSRSYLPDRTTVLNISQSLVKIASRSASLAEYFDPSVELAEAKAILSGMQCIFSIRSGINSIEKLYYSVQAKDLTGSAKGINILTSISATVGIASSGISILKTLNRLDIIPLAKISEKLGETSLVGQNLASAVSLSSISSGFGICRSIIGIAIDSIRIYERREQIKLNQKKIDDWNLPISVSKIDQKLERIAEKCIKLRDELDLSEEKLNSAIKNTKTTLKAYKKEKHIYRNASGIDAFSAWFKVRKLKKELKHLVERKEALLNQVELKTNQQQAKLCTIQSWNKIKEKWNHLTESEKEKLHLFQTQKKTKWEVKNINLAMDQIKSGSSLVLKVVGLIISIASLVLGMLGFAIIPVFITISTMSLILALACLSLEMYKNYSHSRLPPPIPVPIF